MKRRLLPFIIVFCLLVGQMPKGYAQYVTVAGTVYDVTARNPLEAVAVFFKNIIEKSGIDAFVNGVGKFVNYSSRQLRLVQSGQVGNYILIMVLSIVIFILLWFYDAGIIRLVDKIF